jgi:hypothetical protein
MVDEEIGLVDKWGIVKKKFAVAGLQFAVRFWRSLRAGLYTHTRTGIRRWAGIRFNP